MFEVAWGSPRQGRGLQTEHIAEPCSKAAGREKTPDFCAA